VDGPVIPSAVQPRGKGIAIKPGREKYVVDDNGNRTAVILPVKEYQSLLDDLHDLAVVAERREETPISIEEMKRRLAGGMATR